jgi:hypothetical protein
MGNIHEENMSGGSSGFPMAVSEQSSSGPVSMRMASSPYISDPMMRKAEEINLILLQPEVDLWRLRELALSEGGLVNGEFEAPWFWSLVMSLVIVPISDFLCSDADLLSLSSQIRFENELGRD